LDVSEPSKEQSKSGKSNVKAMGQASNRPLSAGLVAGPYVFLSGQVATDPKTGKLVGDDIRSQTTQVIDRISALLLEVGLDLSDVVKTTVFLTDMSDFEHMNEIYGDRFGQPMPTRSTIGVASLAIPGLKVEIEAIALRRDAEAQGAI
jgi:2-iminobutanoate/2-iminopropanoate deaminase